MHDYSLGPPVDEGEYTGPMVDGKPLHQGNCMDGVDGCPSCNRAIRRMDPEKRRAVFPEMLQDDTCDWCRRKVDLSQMRHIFDHEDHTSYEICEVCAKKRATALAREAEDMMWE